MSDEHTAVPSIRGDAALEQGLQRATRGLRGLSTRLEPAVPNPHYPFFCWSFVLALSIATVTGPWPNWPDVAPPRSAQQAWNLIALASQASSLLLAAWVGRRYLATIRPAASSAWWAPFVVICGYLAFDIVVELLLLKPMFNAPRPSAHGDEPLTDFIRGTLGWVDGYASAIPSGYAMRQTILTMFVGSFIFQPGLARRARSWIWPIWAILVVGMLVGTARLCAAAHHLFDVGTGVAFGVYIYWWLTIVLRSLSPSNATEAGRTRFYADSLVLPTIYLFTFGAVFGTSLPWWALASLVFAGPSFLLRQIPRRGARE